MVNEGVTTAILAYVALSCDSSKTVAVGAERRADRVVGLLLVADTV